MPNTVPRSAAWTRTVDERVAESWSVRFPPVGRIVRGLTSDSLSMHFSVRCTGMNLLGMAMVRSRTGRGLVASHQTPVVRTTLSGDEYLAGLCGRRDAPLVRALGGTSAVPGQDSFACARPVVDGALA